MIKREMDESRAVNWFELKTCSTQVAVIKCDLRR